MFLNAAISNNILLNVFKLSVVVLNTFIERMVSQISFLGPRLYIMHFRKLSFQKLQNVSRFWS